MTDDCIGTREGDSASAEVVRTGEAGRPWDGIPCARCGKSFDDHKAVQPDGWPPWRWTCHGSVELGEYSPAEPDAPDAPEAQMTGRGTYAQGRADGAAEELEAVVPYLRGAVRNDPASPVREAVHLVLQAAADAIERGEHRPTHKETPDADALPMHVVAHVAKDRGCLCRYCKAYRAWRAANPPLALQETPDAE